MFLLNWGVDADKTVEGGVDRVVIYGQNLAFGTAFFGDAWTGVVGINFSELATTETTFYDTRPIRQKTHTVGISGTVEAYTTPRLLQTNLAPGVSIGNQSLPITHMSYRTMITSATQEPAYTITIIYGVAFQSAEIKAQSFDKDPNAELKQWTFSAYPRVDIYPYTPSTYLTVRTDKASAALVSELEKRLYGAPNAFAYMPSITQVQSLVETYG